MFDWMVKQAETQADTGDRAKTKNSCVPVSSPE